jgi:hypothetical protein
VTKVAASEQPRRSRHVNNPVGPIRKPRLVPTDVLGSNQRGFRSLEVAPTRSSHHAVAGNRDAVEEIVGRQEGEVAAEVPIALDQVIDVARHVLLVTGEHDQPVVVEAARARPVLEIVVRDEVGLEAAAPVPAQEAEPETDEL